MIKVGSDFDTAHAYNGSSAPALPAGGHVCKILGAKLDKARSGAEMLVIAFEIQEGSEYDGYYAKLHERYTRNRPDAKWPGMFRSSIITRDGKTNSFFKGLITAIEESNTGYSFKGAGCEEATLKGKMVAFNFGEEEWRKNDGTIGVDVKPFYAISVKHAREGIEPPPRKNLPQNAHNAQRAPEFTEVQDDELPF